MYESIYSYRNFHLNLPIIELLLRLLFIVSRIFKGVFEFIREVQQLALTVMNISAMPDLLIYFLVLGDHEMVMLGEPGPEMIAPWHRTKWEQSD